MFNNLFFPAFVETHFTLGGGYSLSKTVSLDAAIVMASEKSKAVDTSQISSGMATAIAGSPQAVSSSEKTTHSQIGYTVSVRYDF
jgi:long-chain fatty acid transport protein